MREGRVVAAGSPSEVVTPELVRDVFGLEAQVIDDPVSGTPLVVPLGRHHR
jgi:iron complex transport system ATP-binding protein